jgi:hypothetical protein
VVNGGFEVFDANAMPTGWIPKATIASDKVKCNTETNIHAYAGECAFRFDFTGDTNISRALVQFVADPSIITANDVLMVKAAAKGSNLTLPGKIQVRLIYANGTRDKVSFNTSTGTFSYILYSQSFVAAETPTQVRIRLQTPGGSGKFFVDEVSLFWMPARGGSALSAKGDTEILLPPPPAK